MQQVDMPAFECCVHFAAFKPSYRGVTAADCMLLVQLAHKGRAAWWLLRSAHCDGVTASVATAAPAPDRWQLSKHRLNGGGASA